MGIIPPTALFLREGAWDESRGTERGGARGAMRSVREGKLSNKKGFPATGFDKLYSSFSL